MAAAAGLADLKTFHAGTSADFDQRSDALFKPVDAMRVAGLVPSFAHLSLQQIFERGWGSLYGALTHGGINNAHVRKGWADAGPGVPTGLRHRHDQLSA